MESASVRSHRSYHSILSNIIQPIPLQHVTTSRGDNRSIVGSHISRLSRTQTEIKELEQEENHLQHAFTTAQDVQNEIDLLDLELLQRRKEQLLQKKRQAEEFAARQQQIQRELAQRRMRLLEEEDDVGAQGDIGAINNNVNDWLNNSVREQMQQTHAPASIQQTHTPVNDVEQVDLDETLSNTDDNSIDSFDCFANFNSGNVLLRIGKVTLYGTHGSISTFAIFDEGSQSTMIDETIAKHLGLKGKLSPVTYRWTSEVIKHHPKSMKVNVKVSGPNIGSKTHQLQARTIENLSLPQQNFSLKEIIEFYPNIDTDKHDSQLYPTRVDRQR